MKHYPWFTFLMLVLASCGGERHEELSPDKVPLVPNNRLPAGEQSRAQDYTANVPASPGPRALPTQLTGLYLTPCFLTSDGRYARRTLSVGDNLSAPGSFQLFDRVYRDRELPCTGSWYVENLKYYWFLLGPEIRPGVFALNSVESPDSGNPKRWYEILAVRKNARGENTLAFGAKSPGRDGATPTSRLDEVYEKEIFSEKR